MNSQDLTHIGIIAVWEFQDDGRETSGSTAVEIERLRNSRLDHIMQNSRDEVISWPMSCI
jgi:hypothetical protein